MQGYDSDILQQRSRHDGGLTWEAVRVGQRTIRHNLRVVADSRLIASLTDAQCQAMWSIARAYSMITAGLGAKCSDLSHVRGGGGDIMYGAALIADYFTWSRAVKKKKLNHDMTMDIIAFGHSLRDIDRNRRQAKGTARKNLGLTLDLWGNAK